MIFENVAQRYRALLKRALERSPFRVRKPPYRVGKYYADYSGLTEAELGALPDCDLSGFVSTNRRALQQDGPAK